MYFFKRKYRQIKSIIKWIPILWDQFDFDHIYATDVFKTKLLMMADYLESDKARCVGAKDRGSRIRMIVRLMDKVYNEDYSYEYFTKLESLYGEELLETKIKDNRLVYNYELTESQSRIREIDEARERLLLESNYKQERAHKLLWELIEHNIRNWWD